VNFLRRQNPVGPGKTWKVGTLTYTAGGLVVLFFWLLLGDFAWSIKQRAVDPVAQLLLKKHEATDILVGILVGSVPSALGMLLGPVVGVLSDRHRGRRGRRIPFLLLPTPFAALSMAGVAFTPLIGRWLNTALGEHSPGENACVVLVFAVFWVIFEFATTIANAVFTALINDVVPQQLLGRFFGLFRAISLLAGILFNLVLMGKAESHYMEIFLGLGLFYGIGFTVMCLKVTEGDYPPPPERAPNPWRGILQYLRESFTHPYYLWVFLAMALAILSFGPVNSFSVFYARSIGVGMDDYGRYLAITYLVSLVISYTLGSLADRFHPLRMAIGAMVGYALVALYGWIFARSQGTFAVLFILHGVLSGIYLTGAASLGQRLFPKAQFAQFASAAGILASVCYMILPPAVGLVLEMTGHQYHLTFLMGGLLAIISVAVLLVVYRKFLALGGDADYEAPTP